MAPRRLTPTATLVLGVLRERPMHPYEILSRLAKRRDDRLVRLSPGAVYHAIDRLERDGLVAECGVERHGKRPERTTYAVTPAGRAVHVARTRELVTERPREYPAFPVGLALIHDLDGDDAAHCLRARRDAAMAEIAGARERLDAVVARGLPRRFVLDGYHEIHQAEAEIAWLDATILGIESGALSWTETPSDEFRTSAESQSM